MNQDDVVRMAREAFGDNEKMDLLTDFCPRFAALVEAATINKLPGRGYYHEGYEAGAAHEREECAKVCELLADGSYAIGDHPSGFDCAEAIRARGQA